jgi:HSP20 family protein
MFGLIPRKEKERVGYPMPALRNEFKALYDRFFGGWPMMFEPTLEPESFWGLEMKETEKEVVLRAEIPGFEAGELEVEFLKNRLMIKAEKKHEVKEKGKEKETEKREEFVERRYERFVELPVEIEPTKVEATYRNGVLEVHLPKTEEAKAHRIPVT